MWNIILPSILGYLIIINIVGFLIMGIDKNRAKKHEWRIRERVMFAIAVFGGSIGVFFGMQNFRHKTKHPQFIYGIPVILFMQIIIVGVILKRTH